MATELKLFQDAYATMTVAIYEPIIVRWFSGWTLLMTADTLAGRLQKAKYLEVGKEFATAQLINIGRVWPTLPPEPGPMPSGPDVDPLQAMDLAGNPLAKDQIRSFSMKGFPFAQTVGKITYPQGVLRTQPASSPSSPGIFQRILGFGRLRDGRVRGSAALGARTLPTSFGSQVGVVDPDFDFHKSRKEVFQTLTRALEASLGEPWKVSSALREALLDVGGSRVYEFLPVSGLEEGLSPIGIAHFYRQLYFNAHEGLGPIEQAFTVAPNESLEVVYEVVRRQTHEEISEFGSEVVSERATDEKNLDEVSDKVGSMIQRDSSASMSANASGSIGVWQVGASASADLSASSKRSKETTTRRLKEVTKRASERITKTYSLRVRDLEEVTTTNLTRRVIANDKDEPVSYGLRRVLRRVRVKVQDLGPRLVWQLYVRNPGSGLARSKFVHFRESDTISVPEIPPGMPPRPRGDTDTGSTNATIVYHETLGWAAVPIVIHTGSDRIVTAVSIDSITDLEGGGKDDQAPSAINTIQTAPSWDEDANTYTTYIAVSPGDSSSVSVSYTYAWDPSGDVLDEWEAQRQRRVGELEEAAYAARFEREKTLITEKSKIRKRPSNDLRREERYEVMNRMVAHLFLRGDDPSGPTALEIEFFHRYFEIDSMFLYTHPSWWKPRYTPVSTGFERPAYEITDESEPAPLGASLGWMIQLDGDARRNEFLNSPWLRVCIPFRPRREREGIEWLAKHIEGDYGYEPTVDPLKSLLDDLEAINQNQDNLGTDGPDWVTVDSTVGAPADPLSPEGVYPVVDDFEVTVPTDGFVYDSIKVAVP
jgi:hypothetical protein